MPYRPGDQTHQMEVRLVRKLPKSYLVETTEAIDDETDSGQKYFVPFSQIATDPIEPDPEGRVLLEITDWWWKKRDDFKAD